MHPRYRAFITLNTEALSDRTKINIHSVNGRILRQGQGRAGQTDQSHEKYERFFNSWKQKTAYRV